MPSGRDVHVIVDVTFLVRYADLSSLNFQSKELCNYCIKCPDFSHTYPSGWLADKICDQKTQGIKMKQKILTILTLILGANTHIWHGFEVEQRFQT